ncbi:MAG: hypothetical protein COV59_01100 [Candidatus Magasanikbacteria bacterium CG11_big_fil_rev_8_21_14_0_20_39_34]|uniref:Uncharacterized protein n=1 Tax=Candidatus Magasanikbacteria bacterium CG11_big_fil_rev_8_21_14_0_20_39_34 TaxID=1974653 RepID=A0A2H0N6C0_9BACT|nr:MAG: hypothetical protein COV59_01100 [Candidatus Magasanikbacteria bacterium CG11_big_fil_rev_8_21_14_0_20_39_34]
MPQSSAYKERVQQEVLGTKKVLRDFGIEKIKSDADLFKALRALRDAGRLDELKALLHARREAITTALGKTIILGGRDGKSRYFEGEVVDDLPNGVGRIIEGKKVEADGEFKDGYLQHGIAYRYDGETLRFTTIVEEAYPNGRVKSGSIINAKDGRRLSSEAFHEDGTTDQGELIDENGIVLKEGAFVVYDKHLLLSSGQIEHYPHTHTVHIGDQDIPIVRTDANSYRFEKQADTYQEMPEGKGTTTDTKGQVYEIYFEDGKDYRAQGYVKVYKSAEEHKLLRILNREISFAPPALDQDAIQQKLAELRTGKGEEATLRTELSDLYKTTHDAHTTFNNELVPFIQKNYVDASVGDIQSKLKIGHFATKLNAKITTLKKQANTEPDQITLKHALDTIRYQGFTKGATESLKDLLAEYCTIDNSTGGFISDSNKDAFLAAYSANMEATLAQIRSTLDTTAEAFLDEKKAREITSGNIHKWFKELGEAKGFSFSVAGSTFEFRANLQPDGSLHAQYDEDEMNIVLNGDALTATVRIAGKESQRSLPNSKESLKLLLLGFKAELEKKEQSRAVEAAIQTAANAHIWPCWDEKTQSPASPAKLDEDTGKNFDAARRRVLHTLDFSIDRDTYFEIYTQWFDAHIAEYGSSGEYFADVYKGDREKKFRIIQLLEKDSFNEDEKGELTELLSYLEKDVKGNHDLMSALEYSSDTLKEQIKTLKKKLGIKKEKKSPTDAPKKVEVTQTEQFQRDLQDAQNDIAQMRTILVKDSLSEYDEATLGDLAETLRFTLERLEQIDPTLYDQLDTTKKALWAELKLNQETAEQPGNEFVRDHTETPEDSEPRMGPYAEYDTKKISSAIHAVKELVILLSETDEELEDATPFMEFEMDLIALLYLTSNKSGRKTEVLSALHGVFDNPGQFFESLNNIEDVIADEYRERTLESPISAEDRALAMNILNILNKDSDLSLSVLEKRAYYCAKCIVDEREDTFLRIYRSTVTDTPDESIESQRMLALVGQKNIPEALTAEKVNEILKGYYYTRINEHIERMERAQATKGRDYATRIKGVAQQKSVSEMDETERTILESDINVLLLTRGKSEYKKQKQEAVIGALNGQFENYEQLLEAIYKKNLELVIYKRDHSTALPPDEYALVRALIDANNEEEEIVHKDRPEEKQIVPAKHSLFRIDKNIRMIRGIVRTGGAQWLRIHLGDPLRVQERNGTITLPAQTERRIANLKSKYPDLCKDPEGNEISDIELTQKLQNLLEDYYYFEIKTNRANLEERKENVFEHKAFSEMSPSDEQRFVNNLVFFGVHHIERRRMVMGIFGLTPEEYNAFLLEVKKVDDEYTRFKIANAEKPTQEEMSLAHALRKGNELDPKLKHILDERQKYRRNRRAIPKDLELNRDQHNQVRMSLHDVETQFIELRRGLLSKDAVRLYALEPILRKYGAITEERIKNAQQAYTGTQDVSSISRQTWNDAYTKHFYWRLKQAQEKKIADDAAREKRVQTGQRVRATGGTSDAQLAGKLGGLFANVLQDVDLSRAQYAPEKIDAILSGHSEVLTRYVKARPGATYTTEFLTKYLTKEKLKALEKIVGDKKYSPLFEELSLTIVLVEPKFNGEDGADQDIEGEEIDLDLSIPNSLDSLREALEDLLKEQEEQNAEEKINAYILKFLENYEIQGNPGEDNLENIFLVQGETRISAADFATEKFENLSNEFIEKNIAKGANVLSITEAFIDIVKNTLSESADGEEDNNTETLDEE